MRKIVRAFSIFTNAPAAVSQETRDEHIPCLYGMRFFSMLWIMLGNTYIYATLPVAETPVAGKLTCSKIPIVKPPLVLHKSGLKDHMVLKMKENCN